MKSYTDIEQSKKLAEILPIKSADGFYEAQLNPTTDEWEYILFTGNEWASEEVVIPCWSLAALLGVIPKGEGKDLLLAFGSCDGGYHPLWFCIYEETPAILEICDADNPIDACYEMILKLKENNLLLYLKT